MPVKSGTVIFRHWDEQDGLNEIARTFKSLDELFQLCLQTDSKLLVERVVVEGKNDQGEPRILTLTFQSVTIEDQDT